MGCGGSLEGGEGDGERGMGREINTAMCADQPSGQAQQADHSVVAAWVKLCLKVWCLVILTCSL